MINNHTQLLNHLIAKHGLKSYLEIGVQNPANNFDNIIAIDKTGIDPQHIIHKQILTKTSDEFFNDILMDIHPESIAGKLGLSVKKIKYDLIFIDGLHHSYQVKKDFENSLRCLKENGFIVIHDTCPKEEITTCVPRGEQKQWHGDVYKFVMTLNQYPGINFETYNFDEGCTVVWKELGRKAIGPKYTPNWETYQATRMEALNIKPFIG